MLKKALSLLTATIVLAAALCACAPKKDELKISVNGKEYGATQTVLEIGDYDVSLEFFRYCYLAVKSGMLQSDAALDFSKKENADKLKSEVLSETKRMFATLELAKKYKYTLSKEELAEIDSTMKSAFDSAGNSTDYNALLEENNLTNAVYKKALEINALSTKMSETLFGTDKKVNKVVYTKEEAVKGYSDSHVRFMNIYFGAAELNEQGAPLSADEIEKNKADAKKKADAALKEIKNGATFEATMKKYMGNDAYENDLQSYYDVDSISESLGYDLTHLKVGETSEIIFSQNYYFIIHRLENDLKYLTSIADDVAAVYAQQRYEEELSKLAESLEVKEGELYKQIVFDSFGK